MAQPSRWVPHIMGGCRPVLMSDVVARARFIDAHREFVPGPLPAEIVVAIKPASTGGATS